MSFEGILKRNVRNEVNKDRYVMNFKDRPNVSKVKLDTYSNAIYLNIGEIRGIHHTSEIDTRYLAATNLTYDLIMSLYDVNTRRSFLYRLFETSDLLNSELRKEVESMKKHRPNIEARIIGLQNNQDYYLVINELLDFIIGNNIKLVEVDLFGNNTRHIAIDAKLGMSFNILMESRLYRPGELVNNLTIENFEASLMK